jgi:hypothetical protein
MAGPGSGLLSQLCAVDEVTYGVAPAGLTGAKWYAVKGGGTLKGKKTTVQGEGLYAGALHGKATRRFTTEWTADGTIPLELPARGMQQWLYRMLGSFGQTPAALTQDGATGAYKAIHAPGSLQGHSFTVQRGVPAIDGTVEPFTVTGCKVADWEITFDRAKIAELVLTIAARNELAGAGNSDPLNGSVPGLATYSEPLGGVFTFAGASIYTGGTPSTTSGVTSVSGATLAGNIKSGNIKYAIPLDTERFFAGQAGFKGEPLENGVRALTGGFVIEWLSTQAMLNTYLSDAATTIEYRFTGPPIGTGTDVSMFSLLVPNIHLNEGPPEVPGPQVVTQQVTWTGLDDDANNPLQVTYWTLDTA